MKHFKTALAIMVAVCIIGTPAFCEDEQKEPTTIRIMTFNVLRGGTKLGQPLSQTAKVIQEAKADVVGLQEIGGNVEALAELLGWKHIKVGSTGFVSRFDIIENRGSGVKIQHESGRTFHVFNVHFSPAPYQPYQLLEISYHNAPFIKTEQEAIVSAEKTRGAQVAALLKQVASLEKQDSPVFVVGDFNEPSHLDWTEAAAKGGIHPIKVAFPASRSMAKAGFKDAWRAIHPDAVMKLGFTWTPLTKPDDPKDHHDRIDYVYFRGDRVKIDDVKVVGENKANADIVVSPYPSDHRAVVATFTLPEQPVFEKDNAADPPSGRDE